jgi:hypothetical protein
VKRRTEGMMKRDAWVQESGEHWCRGHIRRNDIFVMI